MSATPAFAFLSWDSAHFGQAIGRINAAGLASNALVVLVDQARSQKIDLLEAFCPLDDEPAVVALEEQGFRYAGIKTTLRQDLTVPRPEIALPEGMTLEEARPEDTPNLTAQFSGHYSQSRYYHMAGLDQGKVRSLFEIWIAKAVARTFDDVCLVLRHGNDLAGFCSLKLLDDKVGRYGLMGVQPAHQGKSLGAYFIQASGCWLRSRSRVIMETVTQGRNRAALRLFERAGFLTHSAELCLYRRLT